MDFGAIVTQRGDRKVDSERVTLLRTGALLAALTATAALASGCGDDPVADTSPAKPSAISAAPVSAEFSAFPDFLDPALAYSQEGWSALWPAYSSLLTYRHTEGADGAELVPGLADSLPQVSADGKTYRLTLRPGLKYSDGTPAKASDFEHAVKRVLNLESGGSFFFEGIEGAGDYLEAGKANADIPGISADDETGEITIELAERDGQFSYALATTFSALVPGDAPFENATAKPLPGIGPYALADVKTNRSFALVRNEDFAALPNVPAGHADRIDLTVVKGASRQADDIISGKTDVLMGAPAGDQLRRVREATEGRYREYTTNATSYFFLNTKIPPFNDVRVRQAVATAVDERALARVSGGLLEPDCNFLPPAVSGYRKLDPCPWGDPTQAPDLAKAKQLVKDAGAVGAEVSVFGDDSPTYQAAAEYLADLLNQLGLKARPRIVSGAVYYQTIGNEKTNAEAGVTGWSQDYPGAANFFQLIDGAAIQPRNNANPGNVADPKIDAALPKANAITDPAKAAPIYEGIDRRLIEEALVLPYGHARATKITAPRIDFDAVVLHPVYGIDLTSVGVRG